MDAKKMTCADCGNANCRFSDEPLPAFCPAGSMDTEYRNEIRQEYINDTENLQIMTAAAETELEGYGNWTRVVEIARFAKKMGYKKIGVAFCVGVIKEARTAVRVLRSYGLEVYGAGCKTGKIPKQDIGLSEKHNELGCNICNPIMQASLLEKYGTEFNVVIGLCVGHDTLFYKYSKAPVTTLFCKDRVLANNPVAALYVADTFYAGKLFGDKDQN